jgi:hypothetical protein
MESFQPGQSFLFRSHPKWRIWRKGFGAAKVLAIEPGEAIVHLSVYGMESTPPRSFVNFMPILERCVGPYIVERLQVDNLEWKRTDHAWRELHEWRSLWNSGAASCFARPLGESLGLIQSTWGDSNSAATVMRVASAFPVKGRSGQYTAVRVLTYAEAESAGA